MLTIGIEGQATARVTQDQTAMAMGSGDLPVLATPAVAALMEGVAKDSVLPYLAEGQGTVGTVLSLRHTSPTPVGMQVYVRSRLTHIDGRRLVFEVEARDEAGPIATAEHERFIIDNQRFMQKCAAKGEVSHG
nr:thioesterase family protein [bacterium]